MPNDKPSDSPPKMLGPEGGSGSERGKKSTFRWFAARQNLQFEIESVQAELKWLKEAGNGPEPYQVPDEGIAVLMRCEDHLNEAKGAFQRWFPRELIVWQKLFLMRQDFLFAVPIDQLSARWETIQRRLNRLEKKELGYWGSRKFKRLVSNRLKGNERGGYDAELRSKLREARKFMDDRVAAQLWRTVSLRRNIVAASIGAMLTTAALIAVLGCNFASVCQLKVPDDVVISLVTMVLAGTLGAQLSSLFVGRRKKTDQTVPLINFVFVRPIIGSAAGLFLFLVLEAELLPLETTQLGYHALAVVFGFSERTFYRTLSSLARGAERSVVAQGT